MSTKVRNIVHIDEEKCTGCGNCVMPCAEGAIRIVDGKAKVMKEEFCDGAGVCLSSCPHGAISIEQREAEPFNEEAAIAFNEQNPVAREHKKHACLLCGAPEKETTLLKARHKGEKGWVCVKCLPRLIHG